MFEVDFYTLSSGEKPVELFLNSLDVKMRAKALSCIAILEESGNRLREPYSKALGDGLFELRIKFASDISRIFYFFYADSKIILTSGFIKKTTRTPGRYTKQAKQYKKDFERRLLV